MFKFHYSSYWARWSRVLADNHPKGPFVEVNLTVPGLFSAAPEEWKRNGQIIIRKHGTARDLNDKQTNELPEIALLQMELKLGKVLTHRLLTDDFLPEIDWALYNKFNNGGAAFERIRKR